MSSNSPAGRRLPQMPELPRGEVLSTYDHYADAMRAVDRLARADFPVSEVSIVGNDVRSVERVTGKLTYGRDGRSTTNATKFTVEPEPAISGVDKRCITVTLSGMPTSTKGACT